MGNRVDSHKPILILQMQRMGDLVLSFPLFKLLAEFYPGHPLWIVGERLFFEPLLPISPQVVYFDYSNTRALTTQPFACVINLSHRPEAATLAGKLQSEEVIGPCRDAEGRLYIRGNWQLYRASITHNNRYNMFHWADMNVLDVVPHTALRDATWTIPQEPAASLVGARVGLFLGASEVDKRPDSDFWSTLLVQALRSGCKPVLLGGKNELSLGVEVTRKTDTAPLNLCGRFSISELVSFIKQLDLLVTPDTGPMHIAAWVGTPVLNLSLGPVNPWETGPFPPGHHVLQAHLDCVGCWRCTQPRVFCKEKMHPGHAMAALTGLLQRKSPTDQYFIKQLREMNYMVTSRGPNGLFDLQPFFSPELQCPERREAQARRLAFSRYWQGWFSWCFGLTSFDTVQERWQNLCQTALDLPLAFQHEVEKLVHTVHALQHKPEDLVTAFAVKWKTYAEFLHPLTGYLQMYLANENANKHSISHVFTLLESCKH